MEIWNSLRDEGWYIKEEICQNLMLENDVPCTLPDIKNFILNIDLREIGSGWNPEDKSRMIPSPMVLQIMSFRDVSQSQKSTDNALSSNRKRILSIEITDGKKQYKCVEMENIPYLDARTLLPGTKIRIKKNIKTLCGIWQLEPLSLEVLGGTVDTLTEQWHTLKKIKNMRYKMKNEGLDGPAPKFSHFDPYNRNQQQFQNVDNFSTKEILNNNIKQVGASATDSSSRNQSESRIVDVEAGQSSGFGQMSNVAKKKVLGDMKQQNTRTQRGYYGPNSVTNKIENRKKDNTLNKDVKKSTLTLEEYEAQKKFNNRRIDNLSENTTSDNKDAAAKDLMMNMFTYNKHDDNNNNNSNRGGRGRGRGRGRRGRGRERY